MEWIKHGKPSVLGIASGAVAGVFASPRLGGFQQGMTFARQLPVQFLGAVSSPAYSALLTFLILKVVNVLIGLRVSHEAETEGLDLNLHDERGYNF